MKQLLLSILFLFTYFVGFGQCPPGFVDLFSQAEVDAFAINFPDCSSIDGVLRIQGDDIVDLTPLVGITSLEGLQISNNNQLETLNGLENLTTVEGEASEFVISNNQVLLNVNGLVGLQTVNTFIFDISNNAALLNVDGLANMSFQSVEFVVANNLSLTQVEGLAGFSQVNGAIIFELSNNPELMSLAGLRNTNFILEDSTFAIIGNTSLSSLDGLDNVDGQATFIDIANNNNLQEIRNLDGITSTDMFTVTNNSSLTVLDAFSGLDVTAIDILSVFNNPNLVSCDSQFLCSFLDTSFDPNLVMIDNNASGCNSIEEVQMACALGLDENNRTQVMSLYPNPVQHTIHISPAMDVEHVAVKIFSASGKMLSETNGFAVDVSELATGIYFMEIRTARDVIIRQFIKD